MRNQPALRTIRSFHDHPGYIAALAQSVRDYWMRNNRPDVLVMSFHGVPRATLDACALALREAGADAVRAVTYARTRR